MNALDLLPRHFTVIDVDITEAMHLDDIYDAIFVMSDEGVLAYGDEAEIAQIAEYFDAVTTFDVLPSNLRNLDAW